MEVEFISEGKVLYTGHITEKIHLNLNSFTIPISAFSEKDSNEYLSSPSNPSNDHLSKKTERKNFDDSFEGFNPNLIKKKKKYYDNDFAESEEEEDFDEESDEYEESENISEDGDINSTENLNNKNSDIDTSINNNKIRGDSSESSSKTKTNQRLLRKYGISDKDSEYYGLNKNHKKIKKELTEEEIAKKTEQARLRKLHAKKLIEDEKREAVERILNEDGRKLRERQKKQNEEIKKKNKMEEEKLKKNLTKIITKYSKDGKIYVRFPQGFLLPSVFNQSKKPIKQIEKCHVEGCNNLRKYIDPKSGYPYCSVNCFKILRSKFQTPEIKIKI